MVYNYRLLTVNEALDQLEQENFFNANVFIMPPDNSDSDGDSEDSDVEQVCNSKIHYNIMLIFYITLSQYFCLMPD